jgi:ribosomal protein L20A (L18A)
MAKFTVKGEMNLGNELRKFTREFEADNETRAREEAYAYFGSKSGIKRNKLLISEITKA